MYLANMNVDAPRWGYTSGALKQKVAILVKMALTNLVRFLYFGNKSP
jgi:hypothetical protein